MQIYIISKEYQYKEQYIALVASRIPRLIFFCPDLFSSSNQLFNDGFANFVAQNFTVFNGINEVNASV